MLISQVWLLTQVFLLVWNQSNLMVGSGLSDQELATDDELSGNEMSVLTVTLALITTWTIYALLNLLNLLNYVPK